MPSLLGLHLGRYDPATSKPSKGWCNDIPFDDSDAEAEWEEYIRQQGSIESIDSNQFETESIASLNIEEASEEAIEDEIERSHNEELRESLDSKSNQAPVPWFQEHPLRTSNKIVAVKPVEFKTVVERAESENNLTSDEPAVDNAIVDNNAAENDAAKTAKTPEEPVCGDDDFDDNMIFALTPETCPGPPPSPRPPPPKIPLRIFIATWNMAAEDPFAHRRRGQYIGDDLAAEELKALLPLGYDVYVVGTQEKVTKHLHAAVLARLKQQPVPGTPPSTEKNYRRLVLTSKRRWLRSRSREECRHLRTYESSDFDSSLGLTSFCGSEVACSMCSPKSTSAYSINSPYASFSCGEEVPPAPHSTPNQTLDVADTATNNSWWGKEQKEREIRGHGDHAFIRRKSTGLSVYYASHLHGRIEAVAAGSHKFTGSKGGIAVTIRVAGDPQTLTFVNCHLEANRIERRRRQLDTLARELPRSLALIKDGDSTLATCSDHVIWMGDFNYRIQSLDGDEVLHLLSAGRLQELHDHYDSMADDLEHVPGLKAFHEPAKWPTFYPTYKKVACRSRLPLSGSTTGMGKDTRWAQHVYQTTYREPFYKGGRLRERVPGWCDRILYCSRTQTPWEDCLKVEQAACSDASRGTSSFSPEAVRDNYRSVNDDLRGSDHSPVTCTFLWSVQR
ncbi:Inositol polyphosphate 5-phosphatase [Phytophthora cinnamomi]|uniref:Inositol polyphosphate 5-phosphatase n=1 Tax=Phytophthora cinnamomi TaxID=4785 RepID=UPI00355A3F48|nr:Inositol polyphosphate 5-phosphatase [Phytophthora cinnamomi]